MEVQESPPLTCYSRRRFSSFDDEKAVIPCKKRSVRQLCDFTIQHDCVPSVSSQSLTNEDKPWLQKDEVIRIPAVENDVLSIGNASGYTPKTVELPFVVPITLEDSEDEISESLDDRVFLMERDLSEMQMEILYGDFYAYESNCEESKDHWQSSNIAFDEEIHDEDGNNVFIDGLGAVEAPSPTRSVAIFSEDRSRPHSAAPPF